MKMSFCLIMISLLLGVSFDGTGQKKKMTNPVIAHRGAWKNTKVPQNSIASLQEAIKMGCVGSEFDVRITEDGHPVVIHDPTHDGLSIDESSYSEVSKLRLSNGEPLPTLESYLKAGAGKNSTTLVLEIKVSQLGKEQTLLLTRKCVETVKKMKMSKKVDYISFDYDACKLVKQLDSRANVAYLKGDVAPSQLKKEGINGIDYNLGVFRKNESWIKEAQDNKMSTNAWTVNKEEDMKWFLGKKFDFITTDEPELLLSLLKSESGK